MSLSKILVELPPPTTSEDNGTISNVTGAINDALKSGANTGKTILSNILRKSLTSTVTVASVALVSLVTYTLYRSYSSQTRPDLGDSSSNARINQLIQETPPELEFDLRKSKKTVLQIEEIEKRLDEFKLSTETLKQIMDICDSEMDKGLCPATHGESDIKMLPTHVCQLPTGKESSDVLALDLGGSSFRVLLIRLRENEEPQIVHKVFIVSESILKGFGTKLFTHISNCLHLFMTSQRMDLSKTYPLGFTFSFPCMQTALSEAILLRWTKGFDCSEVVGKDVVKLLQNAINDQKDIKVKVTVLINDTVGTLMSCAYDDPKAAVGLILGTGTNACYIESIDRIETLEQPPLPLDSKQMIVNTEWGAFGESASIDFIRSRYDNEIDKSSINVGKQIFEKMVSGMYLGEIVRLMILDMIDRELIFVDEMKKDAYRHALYTKGSFYTKYVNEIETDSNTKFAKTKRILKELAGIDNPPIDDCAIVKYICNVVTERAAKLIAAGLAVILKRINKPDVTIAVDGSIFRYHPRFNTIMESTLKNLTNPSNKFKIILSSDGCGRGAAVVAAVAAANDPSFS